MTRNILLILLLHVVLLTGCISLDPKKDPARFYTLSSVSVNPKCMNLNKTIGVARVSIPDYLDRSKIVTEVRENELNIAEFHYWAESLDKSITRVISENLSFQLPCSKILPAPWRSLGKVDYEVHVRVLEFKPQLYKCETLLLARYSIIDVMSGDVVCSNDANITVPIGCISDCYLNFAASMSQALCILSSEIADRF